MRVALVNPPQVDLVDPNVYPPTGLVCLRGAARKWAPWARCDLINAAGDTQAEALCKIVGGDFDAVGFGVTSRYWRSAVELASAVKHAQPRTHLFVGGPHTTTTGETAACFDTTFIGPADKSFVAFLEDLRAGKPHEMYQPIPTDIDDLPFLHHIRSKGINIGSRGKAGIVFTSRGCTHNCCYCAARGMYQRLQFRRIESVACEIRSLRERGFDEVRFMDDTITADPNRLLALCAAIKQYGMRWGCVARADQVLSPPGLLAAMKESGCIDIGFGIESFDAAVLKAIGKKTTPEINRKAVEATYAAGLSVHMFTMISTPGETPDTVKRNAEAINALRGKFHRIMLSTLMPYPGSPIHRDPVRFGCLLLDRDATKYNQHQYVRGKEADVWSPLKIVGLRRDDQIRNIRRMRRFVGELKQTNRGVYRP